jgi:hypothetical protein
MQMPLHIVQPTGQPPLTHTPPWQLELFGHAWPHWPQFAPSVARVVQMVSLPSLAGHACKPAAHPHAALEHVPLMQ